MEIVMNDKTYNYILNKGGKLEIKIIKTSCGWGGPQVKSLWIEAKKVVLNEEKYDVFDYKDIKIFIQKGIKIGERIELSLKASLPLLGSFFNYKGIEIE